MIKSGERLNWMLKSLNLSGKELAAQIEVDASTMSKWRKGKRTLRYGSDYAKKIAEIALDCPAEQSGHILRSLLLEQNPSLNISDGASMLNALCLWLTVPELRTDEPETPTPTGRFDAKVETYIGLSNMFEAQHRFFRLLNDLPPGQVITVTDFCAVDWQHTDMRLIEHVVRDNLQCMRTGHSMRIIDQLTETYRPWDLMFQWLPMYLQKNVSTYFYRNPRPFPMRQNIYLIQGHAAMTVSSTDAAPNLIITSFYRKPEYVSFFGAIVDTIAKDSQLMNHTMETSQLLPFIDTIGRHIKSSRLLYMMNRLPTFCNMPTELLCDVLRDNNVSGELFDYCLTASQKSASICFRCDSRQIYDLDAVEAAVQEPWIVDHDLSAVIGREIRVSRLQFLKQLKYLHDHMNDECYALVVYPFSRLEMDAMPPCNILVQDDSVTSAWDAEKYPCRMYSDDISIVNGFFQYVESVWEHIPPVCKSADWSSRRIGALLADF